MYWRPVLVWVVVASIAHELFAIGLADASSASLRFHNASSRHLRHANVALRIDPISTFCSALGLQDATFVNHAVGVPMTV